MLPPWFIPAWCPCMSSIPFVLAALSSNMHTKLASCLPGPSSLWRFYLTISFIEGKPNSNMTSSLLTPRLFLTGKNSGMVNSILELFTASAPPSPPPKRSSTCKNYCCCSGLLFLSCLFVRLRYVVILPMFPVSLPRVNSRVRWSLNLFGSLIIKVSLSSRI